MVFCRFQEVVMVKELWNTFLGTGKSCHNGPVVLSTFSEPKMSLVRIASEGQRTSVKHATGSCVSINELNGLNDRIVIHLPDQNFIGKH